MSRRRGGCYRVIFNATPHNAVSAFRKFTAETERTIRVLDVALVVDHLVTLPAVP